MTITWPPGVPDDAAGATLNPLFYGFYRFFRILFATARITANLIGIVLSLPIVRKRSSALEKRTGRSRETGVIYYYLCFAGRYEKSQRMSLINDGGEWGNMVSGIPNKDVLTFNPQID